MPLVHPKSFVAGVLLLFTAVRSLVIVPDGHAAKFYLYGHYFVLFACPLLSALCFRHAFIGRRPLLGEDELHTSVFLRAITAIFAVLETYLAVRYERHRALTALTAAIFYVAAGFYTRQALRERNSDADSSYS